MHWKHPGAAPLQTTAPNQVWTIDYKGQFRMRDGVYSYPLTIVDHFSRYPLCCPRASLRLPIPTTSKCADEQSRTITGAPSLKKDC